MILITLQYIKICYFLRIQLAVESESFKSKAMPGARGFTSHSLPQFSLVSMQHSAFSWKMPHCEPKHCSVLVSYKLNPSNDVLERMYTRVNLTLGAGS